jgi:hypothetical protein
MFLPVQNYNKYSTSLFKIWPYDFLIKLTPYFFMVKWLEINILTQAIIITHLTHVWLGFLQSLMLYFDVGLELA